jgi:hypothetical protein
METFNLLFESLSKIENTDNMIFKLYERLLYYRLNPSFAIISIVMRLVDKKSRNVQSSGNQIQNIIKFYGKYEFKDTYDSTKFRKRTFKNRFDLHILSDDVRFHSSDSCMECGNELDLDKLSRDFNEMRRDILWATCEMCGANLLPKIGVRMGSEFNKYNKLQFDTSSFEGIVLYSPFFLKYNYNNGLLKEFRVKLDIENFKLRFNALFWDSIWYFSLKHLDFDFMLPYQYNIRLSQLNLINYHLKIYNKSDFLKENRSKFSNFFLFRL